MLPQFVFKSVAQKDCNDGKDHSYDDRTYAVIYINRKGKVVKVEVPNDKIEEKCKMGIINTILPLKFVPAEINGEKVNSIYERIVYIRVSEYTEYLLKEK